MVPLTITHYIKKNQHHIRVKVMLHHYVSHFKSHRKRSSAISIYKKAKIYLPFRFYKKEKSSFPCSNGHSPLYLKPCFDRSLSRWFRYFRAPCLVQLFYFFASMNIGYFHPFFIFQVFVYNVWFFNFGLSNYGSVIYLCAFQCFYFDYKMIRKYQWDFTKLTWCSR